MLRPYGGDGTVNSGVDLLVGEPFRFRTNGGKVLVELGHPAWPLRFRYLHGAHTQLSVLECHPEHAVLGDPELLAKLGRDRDLATSKWTHESCQALALFHLYWEHLDRTVSDVELVVDAHAEVGEGPVWHAPQAVLIWVDITRNLVHRYKPSTGQNGTIDVGQPVGAAVARASGGLVLALRDGFGALDPTTGEVQIIAAVEADIPGNRMNDGAVDSAGRFWAGTMDFDERPGAGALYRLETDHQVVKILGDLTISNGIGWSLDDRTMYFIDSGSRQVTAFDYDAPTGAIANPRQLVAIPPQVGVLDGLAVDAEGYVWVALWGGWAVHRYTPSGALDRVVELPTALVSSCAFGGPDLADLYITTATRDLSPGERADQPQAGGLFRCRPGVTGLPSHSFLG